MGGGGGYFRTKRSIDDLRHEAVTATRNQALEGQVNGYLNTVLAQVNDRDTEAVQERLDNVNAAISEIVDETVNILFGGSVAKHTYVDGLSDVDALVVIAADQLPDDTPREVLAEFASVLRNRLPEGPEITEGRLAVTVAYADGMELQLLPAVRRNDGLLIASASGDHWSAIDPGAFASKLSAENARLNGGLVPTIKLAKTVIANSLEESQQPTGYHIEGLAIEAFRHYEGPRTPSALLARLFSEAAQKVALPMSDSTGQSVHVDDYLGDAGSLERRVMAHNLDRIARRIQYATNLNDWKGIVGID